MAGNRPGPVLWLFYCYGGRLPHRYAQWVLHDQTSRHWVLRLVMRTVAETLPAWLFLLLPGPLSLTILLPVFVLLGVGASLVGGSLLRNQFLLEQISGFVLVVFGLAFMGLLPWPERLVGAGLVQGARSRGSRVLLGGAFAVCAAPCIGPVLAAILVLAGSSDTVLQGAALLAVYSLGLAIPFVLAGALFARAMGAFRWLRDHYRAIQFAGGLVMVALGLLLFFGRFYVLRIYVNRAFEWFGLDPVF